MAIRNTQTDKWQQAWFRRLSPEAKLLLNYMMDTCDIAGIWQVDLERAAFETGLMTDLQRRENLFADRSDPRPGIESAMAELEPFIVAPSKPLQSPSDGAYKAIFIKDFLELQNNFPLNQNNPCHRGILRRIENANGLQKHILEFLEEKIKQCPLEGALKPLVRVIGKGKGKGNKGGCGGKPEKPAYKTAAELAAEYSAAECSQTTPEDRP